MRKLPVLLVSVLFAFIIVFRLSSPSEIWAQEVTPTLSASQTESVTGLPDPNSRLFGLQMAFFRLGQNLQLALTRSEEKKARLELTFAQREEALSEKIQSSDNPEKFAGLLEDLQQRHQEKLERVEERIQRQVERLENAGERAENVEQRKEELRILKEEVGERREVRQERTEQRQENRQERQENRQENREERREDRREDRNEDRGGGRGSEDSVRGVSTNRGTWDRLLFWLGL